MTQLLRAAPVYAALFAVGALSAGCPAVAEAPAAPPSSSPASMPASAPASSAGTSHDEEIVAALPPAPGLEVATFAGGCFWCMEGPFEKMDGVKDVVSGYTGGTEPHPSYSFVSSGRSGHREAVRVTFDPDYVTYEELLATFWQNINPTDPGGQFADRGTQYQTAIYVHDDVQRQLAAASKERLGASGRFSEPIFTPILDASTFWVAEGHHQDYYKTNEKAYLRYRRGSGREAYLQKYWGDAGH